MDSYSTRTSKPTIRAMTMPSSLLIRDCSSPLRRTLVPSLITRASKKPIAIANRALNSVYVMLATSHREVCVTPSRSGLTCHVIARSKQITRPQVPDNTISPSLPWSVVKATLQESTKQNLPRHLANIHSGNM